MITVEQCLEEYNKHDCGGAYCDVIFAYSCTDCGKIVQDMCESIPMNIQYGWLCVSCYYKDAEQNSTLIAIPVEPIQQDDDNDIPF